MKISFLSPYWNSLFYPQIYITFMEAWSPPVFVIGLELILCRFPGTGKPQWLSGRHEHTSRVSSAVRKLLGRYVRGREEKEWSLSFRICLSTYRDACMLLENSLVCPIYSSLWIIVVRSAGLLTQPFFMDERQIYKQKDK